MGFLTKVENFISKPMDRIFKQKGFHPIDLSRLALRCMEKGCRKGLRNTYAPNTFLIYLHTTDYKDLYPFINVICTDIKSELQKMVDERNYVLAAELEVRLFESTEAREGIPEIRGVVCCETEPDSVLSSTSLGDDLNIEIDTTEGYSLKDTTRYTENLEEGMTIVRGDAQEKESILPSSHNSFELMTIAERGKKHTQEVTLQTNIPGVSLLFSQDGVALENCLEYDKISVNDKVSSFTKLHDGSVVRIGGLELKVVLS